MEKKRILAITGFSLLTVALASFLWWKLSNNKNEEITATVQQPAPSSVQITTTTLLLNKTQENKNTTETTAPTETTALSKNEGTTTETNKTTTSITVPKEQTGAPTCLDGTWKLTFEDDFQTGLSKWNLYDSPGHAGNGLRRPAALKTQDGNLIITAERRANGETISGGMSAKHQQKFGRYEARVRTEKDPSGVTSGVVLTWPAGDDNTPNGYPAGGENDFYETGEEPRNREEFYTFIHLPDISNGPIKSLETQKTETILRHTSSATEWHTMAMEWEQDTIKIFRDGKHVGTVTDPETIPKVSHYLTVQLDAKNTNTLGDTPVRMFVDWVRIYEKSPC